MSIESIGRSDRPDGLFDPRSLGGHEAYDVAHKPIAPFKGEFQKLGIVPTEGGYNFSVVVDEQVVHAVDLCIHDPANLYKIVRRLRMNSLNPEVEPRTSEYDTSHTIGGYIPSFDNENGFFGEGSWYSLRVVDSEWSRNDGVATGDIPAIDPRAQHVEILPGKEFAPNMNGISLWPVCKVDTKTVPRSSRPKSPEIAPCDLNICEAHVRTATLNLPMKPENANLNGTIAALGTEEFISYLDDQRYNAVSILPMHLPLSEAHLVKNNEYNFWAYSTGSYFALNKEYAATGDVKSETRNAIDRLHEAGKVVIMDVVYNHTAEGGTDDPTYSYELLNRKNIYKLRNGDHQNDSGCGNTLDMTKPAVVREIIESLEWMVEDLGVDGFRFDLAGIFGQGNGDEKEKIPLEQSLIMQAIAEHPILSKVILIAEPWGAFRWQDHRTDEFRRLKKPSWMAWDDYSRDIFQEALRGNATKEEVSKVLTGHDKPSRTINYVASHDGPTLRDRVNGDLSAQALGLAFLAFSQGIPMRQVGAELGYSQNGDHNAYSCKNGKLAPYTIEWEKLADPDSPQAKLYAFGSLVNSIRNQHPVFRQPDVLPKDNIVEFGVGDEKKQHPLREKTAAWLGAFGCELTLDDWKNNDDRFLRLRLSGLECGDDANFEVIYNGKNEPVHVTLGSDSHPASYGTYEKIADTASLFATDQIGVGDYIEDGAIIDIPQYSLVVLRQLSQRLPGRDRII